MKPTTYPEMNAKIVGLLRFDDEAQVNAYAAVRIEELEQENERLKGLFREIGHMNRDEVAWNTVAPILEKSKVRPIDPTESA